jgi:hypothetical protein
VADLQYDKGREKFAGGEIAYHTDEIRVQLINTTNYTVSGATHEFYSSVGASARVGSPVTLAGKTRTNGVLDANDVIFNSVTGSVVGAWIMYKWTGTEATSPLIAYFDSTSGLPFTPNGGNVSLVFDNGPNKIMKI